MFFDRLCPVCGSAHRTICPACVDRLQLAPGLAVPWLEQLTPLFAYDDASSRLVLAAKNGGRRDLLRWLGDHLGASVAMRQSEMRPGESFDVVTWVPAHPDQRKIRGYDQGQILARAVAFRLGVRARPMLARRSGSSQKGLGRADRLVGPDVRSKRPVCGNVLLVDDVMTTGASLECCAHALRSAGAERVAGAIVAASTSKSAGLPAQIDSTIYSRSSSGRSPEAI